MAEADPVTKLTDLLKQRRRWLNGTFFALIYTLSNWIRVWTDSHHNVLRKLVISFEFMYLTILTVLGTWFGIGILYTIFYNLAISTFKSSYAVEQVWVEWMSVLRWVCCRPFFFTPPHATLDWPAGGVGLPIFAHHPSGCQLEEQAPVSGCSAFLLLHLLHHLHGRLHHHDHQVAPH